MICPASAHSGIPILLLLCSVLYIHWGQCVIQVWGYVLGVVLAAFCLTKSLLCNVAAFTGILFYPESTLQLYSSRRFCEVFKDLFRFPVSRPDDEIFPSGRPSVTRSFEKFKVASVRT